MNIPIQRKTTGKAALSTHRTRDLRALSAVVVALIIAIEITSHFVPDYILPSSHAIAIALWQLLTADTRHVGITLMRLFAAVGFSIMAGVLVGLVMGTSRRLGPYLRALVLIDTGIPALSWMLIAVFWFKNSETRIFFILVVILLPFYALNVYDGIRALPKDWLDMIESFRPRKRQVLRYLILPQIVPYIFMTTRSVIGYAIRMVIFAELVASAIGIGSRMSLAQSTFQIDRVLAWTVLLVIVNLILQWAAGKAETFFQPWRDTAEIR